jgi:hypothetical protein
MNLDDKKKDKRFGYLKVTVGAKAHTLTCQLMGVQGQKVKSLDSDTISI